MSKVYLGYVWEKLYLAIEGLASGTGSIQDRMYNVYISHLFTLENEMDKVELGKFRESMNNHFSDTGYFTFPQLMELLHKNNGGRTLSDEDAVKVAKSIVSLYNYVARKYGE